MSQDPPGRPDAPHPPPRHSALPGVVAPQVFLPQGSTSGGTPPTLPPPVAPHVTSVVGPAVGPHEPPPWSGVRARPQRRRWPVALLAVTTVVGAVAGAYLWRTSDAWQARAEEYLIASQALGTEIATTRTELADVQAELEAVRAQLGTAQARIVELADEKAQLGDDREIQRQLVDYQERVSEAAGRVALALDQCVQGQNQLIGYMENAAQYDPVELDQYATSVQELCQTATEANTALQSELAR